MTDNQCNDIKPWKAHRVEKAMWIKLELGCVTSLIKLNEEYREHAKDPRIVGLCEDFWVIYILFCLDTESSPEL